MANPAADFGPIIEVEGRTHQEINDSVSSQGVDKVLGHVFNGMAAAFDPNAAGNDESAPMFLSHHTVAIPAIGPWQSPIITDALHLYCCPPPFPPPPPLPAPCRFEGTALKSS